MRASVAIIMPTYQQERYVGSAIQSVIDQSRPDWELVVVDDGSTDGTFRIASAFDDPRITVIRREHGGLFRLGEAYAAGVHTTRAPFVAVLEGDDAWPPDKLERQLPAFDDADVVLAYGAAGQIDAEGCLYATYDRTPPSGAAENRPLGAIIPHLLRQNFVVAATVIVRRSALETIGGFWQPIGIPYVDHPTWLRLASRGAFAHSSDLVGFWRRHPAQFTTSTATGVQPDNRDFLRQILDDAAARRLIANPSQAKERLEASPSRHAAWADVAQFRLALVTGDLHDGVRAAVPLLRPRQGWPKWAGLAMVGLVMRLSGSDLEWIFRRTNRFSWPPRRHRHAADQRQDDPGS